MGQFSVEKPVLPGSVLSGNQHSWTAQSDDPTYLAQLEPILDGLRKAGVPEVRASTRWR
jgi:hypothetical protein